VTTYILSDTDEASRSRQIFTIWGVKLAIEQRAARPPIREGRERSGKA
jgi:hypothetical protein